MSMKIKFSVANWNNIFYITRESRRCFMAVIGKLHKRNKSCKSFCKAKCPKWWKSLSTNNCCKQLIWKFVHSKVLKTDSTPNSTSLAIAQYDDLYVCVRVTMYIVLHCLFGTSRLPGNPPLQPILIANLKTMFRLKCCRKRNKYGGGGEGGGCKRKKKLFC